MLIKEVMTESPTTINSSQSLHDAREVMRNENATSEYGEIIEVKDNTIVWKMLKRNTSVDGRATPKALRLAANHPVAKRILSP